MNIREEIELTLEEIEGQIQAVMLAAVEQDKNAYTMYELRGGYVLSPLLVAKAQLLATLAAMPKQVGVIVPCGGDLSGPKHPQCTLEGRHRDHGIRVMVDA